MTRLVTLSRLNRDPARRMLTKGRWTWKTRLTADDLIGSESATGWIMGSRDPLGPHMHMAGVPGRWQLWISEEHQPGTTAVPLTPVVSVEIQK
jgi:hypothetical protein